MDNKPFLPPLYFTLLFFFVPVFVQFRILCLCCPKILTNTIGNVYRYKDRIIGIQGNCILCVLKLRTESIDQLTETVTYVISSAKKDKGLLISHSLDVSLFHY